MGIIDRILDRVSAPAVAPARDVVTDPTKLRSGGQSGRSLLYSTAAMFNAVTGLGTSRDPSFFNRFAIPRPLDDGERFGAGRNALIKRTIKNLPDTATREGWRYVITDERVEDPAERESISDQITAYENQLDIPTHVARAGTRANQYGEALVLLGIEDGRLWDQPVDWHNVKSIRWAAVIDRRDFQSHAMAPATSRNFGKVESFVITDINGILEDGLRYGPDAVSIPYNELDVQKGKQSGQLIFHADRVLHFHTEDFFSQLDSLQDALGGYLTAMSGITTAARESSMVVYKITSWLKKMWSENANLASTHMELVDRAKNTLNAIVVDKDHEEVHSVNRSLGGVDKLANPSMVHVSAALGQPVTEFWGVSPGGFGTGESERVNWHSTVAAWQKLVLAPRLQFLAGLILVSEDGPGQPRDLAREILFEDLSPPDEKVRSELRSQALSDLRQLVKDDIIDRSEARPAVAALSDDYFRPALDLESKEQSATAPVGIFTGASAILQSTFPEGTPIEAARALLQALAPTYFTPENITSVVPDRAPSGASAVASPDDPDIGLGDEEDDAQAEGWSTNQLPEDAMEARHIARELGIPTVRITRAHRAGLIEGWNMLGGKPRYSYAEVEASILRGNGKLPAETETVAVEGTADKVRDAEPQVLTSGVMLRVPTALARWVPAKPEEPSAPHVTLLYVGKIEPSHTVAVLDAVRNVVASSEPMTLHLDGVGYFDTPEHRVAFASVRKTSELQALHDELRRALENLGITVKHFAGGFTPHVTLAYLALGEEYDGPVPAGQWTAGEAELWYDDLALPLAFAAAEDEVELARDLGPAFDEAAYDTFDEAEWLAEARDLSEEKKQERIDEAFKSYHEAVNMGAAELEKWAATEWSKKAGVSREPITLNLRLLKKRKEDWTLADASAALRTVSFVARMSGAEQGEPVKIDGREGPSKRDISLKNWAFNPNKN